MSNIVSKRDVFKGLSSVFDPLGLFSPVLVKRKLLLQSLWSKGHDWDDEISSGDLNVWGSIISDFSKLSDYEVKRCINVNGGGSKNYLLCFGDASVHAYAAAVYIYQRKAKSECKADLLFSKTRLAPLKAMTIPRLELMAMLIGARYIGSDSQCWLKWIVSEKDLSLFAKNRVKEIRSQSDIVIKYVTSRENPADIASRGSSVQKLSENQLWWHGPERLNGTETEWPEITQESHEKSKRDYESELEKQKPVKEIGLLQFSDHTVGKTRHVACAVPPLWV